MTRKEKSKRKYTKVNERKSAEITVTVDFDDRYGGSAKVVERLKASGSPMRMSLKSLSAEGTVVKAVVESNDLRVLTGRYGATTTGDENRVDGDTVLKLLLWIWQGLGAK